MGMGICAILPDSLGDFLLTTPSLRALEKNFPAEEIVWYLPNSLLAPAELVPLKGKRVSRDGFKESELRKSAGVPDITVCFPPATRYYRMARRLGGKKRGGYVHEKMWVPRIVSRFCLTHRWICPAGSSMHELVAYGKVVQSLGVEFEPSPPLLKVPEDASATAAAWLRTHRASAEDRIVAVHLNGRWPDNPLKFIKEEEGRKILILFDRSEEAAARAMIRDAGFPDALIPGPQGMPVYAALIKASAILLTVDGGAAHVASAVGTPVMVFYPEKQFQFRVDKWHPWGVTYHPVPLSGESVSRIPEKLTPLLATA